MGRQHTGQSSTYCIVPAETSTAVSNDSPQYGQRTSVLSSMDESVTGPGRYGLRAALGQARGGLDVNLTEPGVYLMPVSPQGSGFPVPRCLRVIAIDGLQASGIMITIRPTAAFDFDRWSALAKADPQAFESWRLALIEETIASAPADCRQRMRGLQFRIDLERRRARTPLKACMRISSLMWRSVVGENGLLDALNGMGRTLQGAPIAPADPAREPAKLLVFRRDPRHD
jgi:hypothetical protein